MRAIKFLSQKGMTLPEIMIAAALMGGIALVTAKLMGEQSKNQAELKAKADIASTVTRIESFLTDPVKCSSMLGGNVVGQPIGTVILPLDPVVLSFTIPSGAVVNVIGEANYGSYRIDNNAIRLAASNYGPNVTDLVITFTMTSKSFTDSGRTTYTKRIPVVTQVNGANTIVACGPVLGDAEEVGQKKMCVSLGAKIPDSLGGAVRWDDVAKRCVLKDVKCPYGEVAIRMTSLGGIVCVPIAGQVKLEEIFDTTSTGPCGAARPKLRIISNSGKIKVECYP